MLKLKTLILLLTFFWLTSASAQNIKTIKRLSLAPGTNEQGVSYSYDAEMDGNGRYVVFTSTADNFAAAGKVEGQLHEHVYLRDTVTGTTTQLDVTSEGLSGSPSNSFNPGLRTFGSSFDPHLSRDGNYAIFVSEAKNISPDSDPNQIGTFVYIKNIQSGEIKKIPKATAGNNALLEYPTYIAANNDASVIAIVSIISEITGESCTNCWQLTVYDRLSETTSIVPTGIIGNKYNPGISDDGRYIVFENQADNFSNPTYSFLYDRTLGVSTPLNGGLEANSPAISGDGKKVAYTNLASFNNGIKIRDTDTGAERTVTVRADGVASNGINQFSSLSQDGRYLAFLSSANNLVDSDTNELDDIYVYDDVTGKFTSVSVQTTCEGTPSKESFNTGPPTISSDGKTIVFTVLERLVSSDVKDAQGVIVEPGDTNIFDDIYQVELDFEDPDVFKKNLKPDAPLSSVDCKGKSARILLEDIRTKKSGASVSSGKNSKVKTGIKALVKEVTVSRILANNKLQKIKKYLTKKNELTLPSLPAGNYSSTVTIEARLSNGTKQRSKVSNTSNFTITD